MSTFNREDDNFNDRFASRAQLDRSNDLDDLKAHLDLSPATLLCHTVDDGPTKIISARNQTGKSHSSEMAIGIEKFAISSNSPTGLLEASYSSVNTVLGQILLSAQRAEGAHEAHLKNRISELEERNAYLETQINADALTGLLNRRGLDVVLTRELAYARRTGNHLLAALIDLDNFKLFNDNYGHHVGDEVLRCVAQVMKEKIRICDWSSRVGGDEFLILLPSTNLTQGIIVLDRVRLGICDRTIIAPRGLFLHTTVSVGITRLQADVFTLEDVLRVTSTVLKRAKATGKNRISVDFETASEGISSPNEVEALPDEQNESTRVPNRSDVKC